MTSLLDRAGAVALLLGIALVVVRVVPGGRTADVWETAWPALLFLALIKLVADLLDRVGVFEAAGRQVARWGGGSRPRAYAWFMVLCIVVTAFLSLDTTVVLLTPVGLTLAELTGASQSAYAVATLWCANVGSLLLPVSNLTNLLALHRVHLSSGEFLGAMWWPQVIALVVMVVVLVGWHRRGLTGTYDPTGRLRPRPVTWAGLGVVALVATGVTGGLPPWQVAAAALVVVVALSSAFGSPVSLRALVAGVPWGVLTLSMGLLLTFAAVEPWLTHQLAGLWAGCGPWDGVRRGLVSAVGANAANNLPAYLALEPVARSREALWQTLVGVNAGPLMTPWASLATLLWWQSCRERGLRVQWSPLLAAGAVVALVAVPLAALAV